MSVLAGAAALTVAGSALAQGTAPKPVQTKPVVGAPSTGAAPQGTREAVVGNPTSPSPQANSKAPAPSPFTIKPFDDWSLECYREPVRGVPCQIIHQVLTADGKQVLFIMSLAWNAKDKRADVQMALPLGFALAPGVEVKFGNAYQSRIPINRCSAQGCIVEGVAAREMLNAMTAAKAPGTVRVALINGRNFTVPLSTKGFASAFRAMLEASRAGN